jgi:glycosyltransferase involved in cell wall biosynthesis
MSGEKSNKKIKVCIVINDFMVGGAQKLIVEQIRYFDKERFEISLITLFVFKDRATLYHLLPSDLDVYKLNFENVRDLGQWRAFLKTLRSIEPHIIISHLFFANFAVRILKPFIGGRIITVEHNTYTSKTFIQRLLDRLLSMLTYRIVAVSNTVKTFTSAQESIPLDKFEVILNGIDIDEVRKKAFSTDTESFRRSLNLTKDKNVFLNIGRLTPQKNHKLLVDSFAEFSKAHKDHTLYILGEGSLMKELNEQIVSLGMSDKIFLMGARNDVPSFLAIADAFVSTSKIEGLSIAYLESLACGVPIIATKTAGTDELIEDGVNGFFVDEDIPSAVAGMEKVLKIKDKLKAGCIVSSNRFDIKANVRGYECLMM